MAELIIIIISIWGLGYAVLSHIMTRGKEDNKIEENLKKHETRTGGLHSDYKYGQANKKKYERQ